MVKAVVVGPDYDHADDSANDARNSMQVEDATSIVYSCPISEKGTQEMVPQRRHKSSYNTRDDGIERGIGDITDDSNGDSPCQARIQDVFHRYFPSHQGREGIGSDTTGDEGFDGIHGDDETLVPGSRTESGVEAGEEDPDKESTDDAEDSCGLMELRHSLRSDLAAQDPAGGEPEDSAIDVDVAGACRVEDSDPVPADDGVEAVADHAELTHDEYVLRSNSAQQGTKGYQHSEHTPAPQGQGLETDVDVVVLIVETSGDHLRGEREEQHEGLQGYCVYEQSVEQHREGVALADCPEHGKTNHQQYLTAQKRWVPLSRYQTRQKSHKDPIEQNKDSLINNQRNAEYFEILTRSRAIPPQHSVSVLHFFLAAILLVKIILKQIL